MSFKIIRRPVPSNIRQAFTLVEMLVAVTLVLLMMTMFAEIFTLATSSMSKQKGLGELDQRQRVISTLVRSDIASRTFSTVLAFHPADSTNFASATNRPVNVPFDKRLGYFYISENDIDNDNDDVLQLTVTHTDDNPFFGRAWPLLDINGNGERTNPAMLNQPEYDDSTPYNFVGSSTSAEVAYFLRDGILYRRVLLIRSPLIRGSSTDELPRTPAGISLVQTGFYPQGSAGGTIYTESFPPKVNNNFLTDFDYSATYDVGAGRLTFLGVGDLNAASGSRPLSIPNYRFGFHPVSGLPVEYVTGGFFGRYTHEETSNSAFGWPGNPGWGADGNLGTADDTNPYTRPVAGLTLLATGAVDPYSFGDRQGDDILLTNVQSFDVKVWDSAASFGPDGQPGVAGFDDDGDNTVDNMSELGWPLTSNDDGAFVDIGHQGLLVGGNFYGDYALPNRINKNYGPIGSPSNNCFDSWYPGAGGALPPYRPIRQVGLPGLSNFDDDGDGTNDNVPAVTPPYVNRNPGEVGYPNSDDLPVPMKAIQIRIRYRDIASGLTRDMTIIESLK